MSVFFVSTALVSELITLAFSFGCHNNAPSSAKLPKSSAFSLP